MTLFAKIFTGLTALLVLAAAVLVLTPLSVSHPADTREIVELAIGLAAVLALTAVMLSRTLAPLRELRHIIERREELGDGERAPVHRDDEVGQVAAAYNSLLDRLAAQETRAAGIALTAQEGERRRVSRELHDQIGQTLTVALLRLGRIVDSVPQEHRDDVVGAQEAVRAALSEVRHVAAQLRPGVLEDLGLVPALTSLAVEAAREGDLDIRRDITDVPGTTPEQELVVYRIAQEALTNVLRHAQARTAWVALRPEPGRLVLEVADNGVGLSGEAATGRMGMTERAALVSGRLTIGPARDVGTLVRFTVPVSQPSQPQESTT